MLHLRQPLRQRRKKEPVDTSKPPGTPSCLCTIREVHIPGVRAALGTERQARCSDNCADIQYCTLQADDAA